MSSILKGIGKKVPSGTNDFYKNHDSNNSAANLVKHVKAARDYLGRDPEPKEEPEETNESYWGGPSPAQLRFNRALKKQQNSPENKADREKFQRELDRIMPPPKKEPEDKEVTEGAAIPTHGTTGGGYTWRFEAGREIPWKTGIEANTFIRVADPAGKTVAGVWADLEGDSLEIEYSQVFDEELRGRGLYTDLLKSLSDHYAVTSDTDTNNAAAGIYRRLGADYDYGQGRHTLRKKGVAEGKVKLYTDPGYFGAEIDDAGFDNLPIINISANQLVGFEPDSKMNQPKSRANVEKIVAGLKQGAKLPPLLVRKYKNGYQVLDGHHRFWAYKLLGVKSIPSRIVPDEDIEEISKQGVAEGTDVDVGGIQLNVSIDGSEVIIRPIVDEYQAGYVVFDRDGNTLVPADLAIDEQFRGQGIAKIIYDYVKSLGFTIRRSSDQTKAGKHFWDKNRGEDSQVWEQTMTAKELDEACWKGYHKEGMKTMFGKKYPNCVKNKKKKVAEGGSETSWSTDTEKITLQDILELTNHIKQINLPINDNLKSKLIHWDGNPKEIERINQVTVSNQFPILVMLDGQGQIDWILDGNHRLHKAIKSQAKTIPAKLIKPSDLNDKAKRIFQIAEEKCPHCNGPMFSEEMINEKKDACYYKVKSRYKVWPSAYASGALVQCRKKGASNWGTKSESSILEGLEQTDEDLHKWFKEKWVRFGPDGKIRGACARGGDSEGKPKCLPQSKAQNLGKKGRASAASRKRRQDPDPERHGKAINVATKKKTTESSILQGIRETKGLPMPGFYEQEYGPFKNKGGYRIMTLTSEQEELEEKWSNKYKRSIDCSHPKGFSQRAHCQGKKKK